MLILKICQSETVFLVLFRNTISLLSRMYKLIYTLIQLIRARVGKGLINKEK